MYRTRGSWLAVGRIRKPHGLHGELVAEPLETDFPSGSRPGSRSASAPTRPTAPSASSRCAGTRACGCWPFVGVTRCEDVEPLRNHWLFLPAPERSSLPPTYYYEHELLGCPLP